MSAERVAIYSRVSTDEQRERQTVQAQLHRCREHAERQGWDVVAEFADEGVSGSVAFSERPEGKRLLDVAGDGLFGRVLVLCVDRLSRDVVDAALVRKELERRGTPLAFVLQSFDGTPEGELQFNIFSSFAQYERRLIGRRSNDGKKRAVRAGRYMCSVVAYGYLRGEDGALALHPGEAPVVRRMFDLAKDGAGLRAIAEQLNAEGVRPPDKKKNSSKWGWHWTTIFKFLTARRYVGEGSYAGEAMECPALVDRETFDAVQEAMKTRKRRSARNTKHFYLLQHLVRCRECGAGLQTRTTKTGLRLYMCHQRTRYGKRAGHEGIKWRWRCDDLDQIVKDAVRKFYLDPDQFLQDVDLQVDEFINELSADGDRRAFLVKKLAETDEEEKRVLSWARKGIIDDKQMQQQLAEVRAERWALEAQIEELRKVADQADTLAEAAEWFRALASSLPVAQHFVDEQTGEPCEPADEQWRAFVTKVVDAVWIERDGSVTLEGVLVGEGSARSARTDTSVLPSSR